MNPEIPVDYQPQTMALPKRPGDDFERWRFDIEDVLLEIELNIMGFFFDPDSGKWEKKGIQRMNERGAKAVRTALAATINKVTTMTTLTIDEIHAETKTFALNLNRLFFLNHDEYGINSPTDGQSLLWYLSMFVFNGLKQSEGSLSVKSLMEMNQTMRHVYGMDGTVKKGGGFLSFFKGKNKEPEQ